VSTPVGLIAGFGRFPLEMAAAARSRGHRVVAVALRGLADPGLARAVDAITTLPVGQLERLLATFREAGVEQVVMAGKVPKTFLYQNTADLELDARALELLASLADRKDDSILGALSDALESEGFELLEQAALAPELWAGEGVLGSIHPSADQWSDIQFGWPVAKALGELDIGQTVVVERGAVLALEAIEGTDAAIRRGCTLGAGAACVLKVAKPSQDPRFDVPAVGASTIAAIAESGGALLAVEAGCTLLLERCEMLRAADAARVAVVGVDAERLNAAGSPS
jgi:DUF1009 family protein